MKITIKNCEKKGKNVSTRNHFYIYVFQNLKNCSVNIKYLNSVESLNCMTIVLLLLWTFEMLMKE